MPARADAPKLEHELSDDERADEQRSELVDAPVVPSPSPELVAALELAYDGRDRDDYDRLVSLLDTPVDDATIVERHCDELTELVGIAEHDELVAWVATVRSTLLARHARELNQCEDDVGGRRHWIVTHGTVVDEEGVLHRMLRQHETLQPSAVAVVVRTRSRGRRRRPATVRRSRSRSPGRDAEPSSGRHPSSTRAAA